MKKVFCVIVTFNGEKWIKRCLSSINSSDYPVELIIVDNLSLDKTLSIIEFEFPSVRVLRPPNNLGFGKGNNLGIELALSENADFVFLLNQDAYVQQNTISSLVNAFSRHPRAALISPIHLCGDNRNLDFGFYKYLNPQLTPFILGDAMLGSIKTEYKTAFINAAAWMVSASVFAEVGMFHPAFDHYGEDREFCSRLSKFGYDIMVNTESVITHDRPQNRKDNRFHKYADKLARDLLTSLIIGQTTYSAINKRLFRLMVFNLVSLRIDRMFIVLRHWRWLYSKRDMISGASS